MRATRGTRELHRRSVERMPSVELRVSYLSVHQDANELRISKRLHWFFCHNRVRADSHGEERLQASSFAASLYAFTSTPIMSGIIAYGESPGLLPSVSSLHFPADLSVLPVSLVN